MSISLYPKVSGTLATTPHPVIDAETLYSECRRLGLHTDWWYSVANTATMLAGENTSEAYLLMTRLYLDGGKDPNTGKTIPAVSRKLTTHRITFKDSGATINTDGWLFHSARAIDGTNSSTDPNTVYLVKFVDMRWLWSKMPAAQTGSGVVWDATQRGFNVIDINRTFGAANLDDNDLTKFPYISETVNAGTPYTWEDVLGLVWAGLTETSLPAGGSYPTINPMDVIIDGKTGWKLFIEVLHASGNEIYPKFDGNFTIKPISDHYGVTSALANYDAYLIEQGNLIPDDNLLPDNFILQLRHRDTKNERKDAQSLYYAYPPETKIVEDVLGGVAADAYIILDDSHPGGEKMSEYTESIIVPYVSYVSEMGTTASTYKTNLDDYVAFVLTRLVESRCDNQVDATYGRFLSIEPCPELEKVVFGISPNGPVSRFVSLPSEIGVSKIDYRPGHFNDRYVAADTTDDTPATLIEKVEDNVAGGTYNPATHQLVWAEVVGHGTDPTEDNKVRFFTTLGTGPPGPAGPPGAAGPTYTAGCGIDVTGTVVSVRNADLLGVGLQDDPNSDTACSFSPYPPDLAGKGLAAASDNNTPAVPNKRVKIVVNPADLYTTGCGLGEATAGGGLALNDTGYAGPVRLKIKPGELVSNGGGLEVAGDNHDRPEGPVKIKVKPSDLCGDGLTVQAGNLSNAAGPAKIKVNTNVTIKVPTSIDISTSGTDITVTLNYTEYQVYGVAGASGSMSDTITGTTCP